MIEALIGALIGSSTTILLLHFGGRLTARQPETYTGTNQIAALGVDIGGNNNGPKLDINPVIARKITDVLPELQKWL